MILIYDVNIKGRTLRNKYMGLPGIDNKPCSLMHVELEELVKSFHKPNCKISF